MHVLVISGSPRGISKVPGHENAFIDLPRPDGVIEPVPVDSCSERLADAFARVACLPMMACAVSVCAANPANVDAVRNYVQKEMGAWGYAESYVRARFNEALRHSPDEINGQYDWAMRQLASGSTEGIGATLQELPLNAVKDFAEGFRKKFVGCIG